MGRGVGASPRVSASETRLLTEAEVTSWVRTAIPGESFIYCSGPSSVPPGPTKDKVNKLRDARVIRPQSRRADCGWEHLVIKLADVPRPLDPVAKPDKATEVIFLALRRCAQNKRRAHSYSSLARIAGLSTRNQAVWRVRKLEEAGRIRTETVDGPEGPWRIVTIGRLCTAAPPATGVAHG